MDTWLLPKALALSVAFLVILYACLIIVKKRKLYTHAHRRINILEYQRLDQKNSLCLVSVDSREFLIAMSATTIIIREQL